MAPSLQARSNELQADHQYISFTLAEEHFRWSVTEKDIRLRLATASLNHPNTTFIVPSFLEDSTFQNSEIFKGPPWTPGGYEL